MIPETVLMYSVNMMGSVRLCFPHMKLLDNYHLVDLQPSYGGLLSSSCGGLQPSAAPEEPKEILPDGRTN